MNRMVLKSALGVGLIVTAVCCLHAQQTSAVLPVQVKVTSQLMELKRSEQRILILPFNVRRVFFGDPELLRIEPMSPRKLRIQALKPGRTQVRLFSADGQIQQYDVSVHAPLAELKQVLLQEFPADGVKVRELNGSLLMSGSVASRGIADSIERVVSQYYPQVVNNLEVLELMPEKQVQLKARIVEISHNDLSVHELKWPLPETEIGKMQHEVLRQTDKLHAFIKTASEKNLLRTVATPEMLTIYGRSTSFEVGGKLPKINSGKTGKMTVQYQTWGIRMDILPEQLENGGMRLTVKPHVSQVVANKSGELKEGLPQIRIHHQDLLVDLQKGERILLYGMPLQRVVREKKKIPLLSDLPLIGETLYHTRIIRDKVELIILIESVEL